MERNIFVQILLLPYTILKWICVKTYAILGFLLNSFVHIFTLLSVLFFVSYAIWEIYHKYHFLKDNWAQVKTYVGEATDKVTKYVTGTYHKVEEDLHKDKEPSKHKN